MSSEKTTRPFNFSPAEWQQIRDAVHAEDIAAEREELDRLLAEASQGMDEIWAQYEDIDLGAYDIDIDDLLADVPDIDDQLDNIKPRRRTDGLAVRPDPVRRESNVR